MRRTVKKAVTKKKAAGKKKAVVKKVVAKKTVKKAVAKKKTIKKTVKKSAVTKKSTIKRTSKQYTKSELLNTIAENSGIAKKDVSAVFDVLGDVIEAHVKKGAVGQFTLPGLMKIKTVRKPATRARKGVNPFTGEDTVFKAKPARNVVKILPLKKLKEMV